MNHPNCKTIELDSFVPPLSLCAKIPMVRDRVAQYCNDSMLVHSYSEPDLGWQVLPREMTNFNDCPLYPAPTLEELLLVLPESVRVRKEDCEFIVTAYMRKRNLETKDHDWHAIARKHRSAATAALQLLFDLKNDAT